MTEINKDIETAVFLRKNANILANLTEEEAILALKLGTELAMHKHGCLDESTGSMIKESAFSVADAVSGLADAGTKGIILVSAGLGIPAGLLAHYIGRRTKTDIGEEGAKRKRIQFYRNAAKVLENEMALQSLKG